LVTLNVAGVTVTVGVLAAGGVSAIAGVPVVVDVLLLLSTLSSAGETIAFPPENLQRAMKDEPALTV